MAEELEREGARLPTGVAETLGGAHYPPTHRLGSVPHEIQNPMEAECELVWRDEDPHAPPYSRQEEVTVEAKALEAFAAHDVGDAGMLYYWIRDDDLAVRRFDRAQCVMQGY